MTDRPKVFIVSESAEVRDSVKELTESAGLQAAEFASLADLLSAPESGGPGCLVFDTQPDDLLDREQLASLAAAFARMPAILITDRGDVPAAVRAVKAGATQILEKPYRQEHLVDGISNALRVAGGAPG